MIIRIQYTFSNYLPLKLPKEYFLGKREIETPVPNQTFVKGSGEYSQRKSKGINNWIGENVICKINKGILIKKEIRIGGIRFFYTQSHFYRSSILNKFELVFQARKLAVIPFAELRNVLEEFTNRKIKVRNLEYEYDECKIKDIQWYLKNIVLLSRIKNQFLDPKFTSEIENCIPQISIELEKGEKINFGKNESNNISSHDNSIRGSWVKLNGKTFRVWFFQTKKGLEFKTARFKRISIMRLHSESECLKNTLFYYKNNSEIFPKQKKGKHKKNRGNYNSDFLQSYFLTTIKKIGEETRSNSNDFDIFSLTNYIKSIYFEFNPGELDKIIHDIEYSGIRINVKRHIVNYINSIHMGDKYNFEKNQIGAVGKNAKAQNNNFQQLNHENKSLDDINYSKLSEELAILWKELAKNAKTTYQRNSLSKIAEAETAAKEKDGNKLLKSLKSAGSWVFDTAKDIGVEVVAELINRQI